MKIAGVESISLGTLSATLADRGLIDRKTEDALRGLITLRNLAVHGPETPGPRARDYIVISEAVLYALSRSPGVRAMRTDDAP